MAKYQKARIDQTHLVQWKLNFYLKETFFLVAAQELLGSEMRLRGVSCNEETSGFVAGRSFKAKCGAWYLVESLSKHCRVDEDR